MATLALKPIKHAYSTDGGAPQFEEVALGSGETPIAGDLLVLINNTVSVAGADPAAVSYLLNQDYTDTVPGKTKQVVQRIKPTEVYEISAYHSSAASAVVPDSLLDVQTNYGLARVTVGGVVAWVLDLAETSTTQLRLVKRLDSSTDTYPRCHVQFLPSALTFA